MSETILTLRINSVLLKDCEKLAQAHEMETERLCEEIIEAYLAGTRLKNVKPSGTTWRKPQKLVKQKVH